jgi:hypothetical protein
MTVSASLRTTGKASFRRRTGGERAATSQQQPTRNDSRRHGQERHPSIAAGQVRAVLAFTRRRPQIAVLGARDGLLRVQSRSAGGNTGDRCGEPTAFWQRSSNPPWRGGGLIQRGGGFVAGRCRPRARRRRRCRVVGSRRSGGRQEQHGVSIPTPSAWPRAWPGEPRRGGDRPRASAPPTRGGATTAAAPAWHDRLVVARAGRHRDHRVDDVL